MNSTVVSSLQDVLFPSCMQGIVVFGSQDVLFGPRVHGIVVSGPKMSCSDDICLVSLFLVRKM